MRKLYPLLFLLSFSLFGQNGATSCEIISKINALLLREHLQPKPIDDSLSVYVFDNLIDELDPTRNLFLKSEYDALSKKYRLNIDDLIKSKNCDFLADLSSVYKKGLLRNKSVLEKLDTETIDYDLKDSIRFNKNKFSFYLAENNIEKVWTKKIRYEILNDVSSVSKNLDSIKTNFKTLEIQSKKTLVQNEICKINARLQSENKLNESFYSYFCNYFDPHTDYFSNDTKSSFVASLSKERLSLGLSVSLNEKNELIVDELDPNGPAFLNKKIKKGDQIISISNQKETLIVSCASLESISNLIQSESNKSITLILKSKTGKNNTVTIEKQILKDNKNTVYSFVIDKKSKTGYIKIPSFYSDFEGNTGKGCAEDVAKEVIKLLKDDIKGLVIDLVDNGGGSMEEAIKLAGMFINTGPISIITDKTKTQTVINDPYRGMLYKGPIVLIINGSSASASEFFASILQDYNRVLLIGSPSLGKATMQTILPLEKDDNTNFVKISINKFYRITGRSHQGTGVIPDVQIPGIYESILPRESNYPTAFKNDTLPNQIKFKPYVKNSLIEELSINSSLRVAKDPYFNSVNTINKKINDFVNSPKPTIPLTLDSVFKEQNDIAALWDEINTFDEKSMNLNVSNSEYNASLLVIYPSEKTTNQSQIDALKTNHYLNEAITIIEEFNAL